MRIIIILLMVCFALTVLASEPVRIGAKHFNEGYLLAEILSQLLEDRGFAVVRKFNLGGTLICFTALQNGEIDLYPEYTGTISEQILKSGKVKSLDDLRIQVRQQYNLRLSDPYGFSNTYALAAKREHAEKKNLRRISDLKQFPDLNLAFSYEFLKRKDGWENLAVVYNLPQKPVGIEHGLAYQAIDEGKVDVIDIYSTDGEIPRYDLIALEDDRNFFPRYDALSFYRPEISKKAVETISLLTNLIKAEEMQSLNALVVFDNQSHAQVAGNFLISKQLISTRDAAESTSKTGDILDKTWVHLQLTFVALAGAMLLAIPLGILIYLYQKIAKTLLYLTGLLQTIPSIALLAVMIPLFGIGVLPAIIALFMYALLPILRNTAIALFSIDPLLKKVATGIGLTRWQRLRYVEIPLAVPTIFAGIKTAAVINIGTATLAAFIGAGGLGEFIVTGLALNDTALILRGAIPAALLAVLVEFMFELIERVMVPRHLLQQQSR